jgi:hypothetical protein
MRLTLALLLFTGVTALAQVARQPADAIAWLPYEDGAAINRATTNAITASGAIQFDRGLIGDAAVYGANGHHIVAGVFVTNNSYTVAAWLHLGSFSGARPIAGQRSGCNATLDFVFVVWTSGVLRLYGNGAVFRDSSVVVPLNQWVHVAAVSSAAGVSFFVNGRTAGSGAALSIAGSGQPIQVGKDGGTCTTFYANRMDDVRVYNRALSAPEIAALANSRRSNQSQ